MPGNAIAVVIPPGMQTWIRRSTGNHHGVDKQMTNSEGIVRFTSIYPGWYVSRTVHIHVKVHINRDTVLTTQLFFDDALNDTINAEVSPYNEHTGRDTYNKTDTIYSDEGLMQAHYDGEKVIAAINIGI